MMRYTLRDIRGLRPEIETELGKVGVTSLPRLAALAQDDERRRAIARETGLNPAQLRRFVGMSEILSLAGITPRHAKALFDAGVDSYEKLRTERQEHLFTILGKVDPATPDMLRYWIQNGPNAV